VFRNLKYFFFLTLAFALQACGPEPAQERTVEEIIRKINTRCPVMIDSETRLEYVRLLPGPGLQYTYRLVHLSQIKDTLAFRNVLWPGLLGAMRTDPALQALREQSYSFINRYEGGKGQYLFSLVVRPSDYREDRQ
jgi:hypothetical protein